MHAQITTTDGSPTTVSCDAVVGGAFAAGSDSRLSADAAAVDEAMEGHLAQHLRASGFKAKPGNVVVVPSMGRVAAESVAVVGLGPEENASTAEVRRAAAATARRLKARRTLVSALDSSLPSSAPGDATAAAAEGYLLGSYAFNKYRSDPDPVRIERVAFLNGDGSGIERGVAYASATRLARDLSNEPAGALYPESLAERARELAEDGGLSCTVWDEKQLVDKGFGGLLAVGRGSERPPRFIQLHYAPPKPAGRVVLVGKGVTFDSGGLSLKDAKSMEDMKSDMSGGAAVLGAMSALPQLQPPVEVHGFIPATENMPGPLAVKPGDVITHYGGRTSEVLNTDAEGRLILADALAFASESRPDAVVDAATLTGSIVVALGRKCAGLFANDEALAEEVLEASRKEGERTWRMPLIDDYAGELDSPVADMKNIASRWGGSIFAALFLRKFVAKGIPWAHLDIAGTARAESDSDECPKGGTGAATRTFLAWIEGRGA